MLQHEHNADIAIIIEHEMVQLQAQMMCSEAYIPACLHNTGKHSSTLLTPHHQARQSKSLHSTT